MGRTKYARRGRVKDGTHQRDRARRGFTALESRLLGIAHHQAQAIGVSHRT